MTHGLIPRTPAEPFHADLYREWKGREWNGREKMRQLLHACSTWWGWRMHAAARIRPRWLLMPVTDQQARAIAFLAAASRPTGATRWDEAGIVANIAKVRDRSLGSVVIAVMQAAEDRKANSPGVIASAGPHWRVPEAGSTAPILNTFDATLACGVCTKLNDSRHPSDHQFVSAMDERRAKVEPDTVSSRIQSMREHIGDAKAERAPEPQRDLLPALPEVDRLRAELKPTEESA